MLTHHSLLEKCKSKPQRDVIAHQSEWPFIQKSTNNKCWRWCGGKGTLLHCWWECKLVQPLWRTVWRFLRKLGIELPYDPGIPLLSKHPKETRTETHVPQCSLQGCLQQVGHGRNLNVYWQMNGKGSCGTFTQWNITQL